MEKKHARAIGVDLGGTKILAVAVDADGTITGRYKCPTPAGEGADAVVMAIRDAVHELCRSVDWTLADIGAVGIAIPAPVDPEEGIVEKAVNLGWIDFPAKAALESLLGKKIHLENDVNAGTYGECIYGAARGQKDVIGIFLGTGIGGGIVLNGKLHRGKNKAAGEVGHMVVKIGGPRQGLGFPGTFESMASRMAIQRYIVKKLKRGEKSVLRDKYKDRLDEPTLRIKSGNLKKAALASDALVLKALNKNAKIVGMHCAGLINFLGPDMIVIGGGVMEALEPYLMPTIHETIQEFTFEITRRDVKIAAAQLGDDAVPLGVAALAQGL